MAIWTPKTSIRVKVLGLVWRGDQLLAGEVEDSSGRVTGVRPLGGSIEFGETREEAIVREFAEELGCVATVNGPWHVFENIFEHEGNIGHEFMFAANVQLGDRDLYTSERITYLEDDGATCVAGWYSPTRLPQGVNLYPEGLLAMIQAKRVAP